MRRCRQLLTEQVAERPAAGGGGVVFFAVAGVRGCFAKKAASCCRGRWCVLIIGGIEPPLLGYESIPLTSGPVQASCTV